MNTPKTDALRIARNVFRQLHAACAFGYVVSRVNLDATLALAVQNNADNGYTFTASQLEVLNTEAARMYRTLIAGKPLHAIYNPFVYRERLADGSIVFVSYFDSVECGTGDTRAAALKSFDVNFML